MRLFSVLLVALTASAGAQEYGASEGGQALDFSALIAGGFQASRAALGSFFDNYEEAPFEVLRSADKYEVRSYPALTWVCTKKEVEGPDYRQENMELRNRMFMKLFAYISGANHGRKAMALAMPVTTLWDRQSETISHYTMCFYVAKKFQDDPPLPADEKVYIEKRPALRAIALKKGGYPDLEEWDDMAQKLKEYATAHGEQNVDFSKFFRVGYDTPFKFFDRRNEVWYLMN